MLGSAAVFAFLGGCSVYGDRLDGNAVHGREVAATDCAACHGAEGNRTTTSAPRLAGLQAGYLYRQMSAFRTASRPSPVMKAILAPLADEDLRDVAVFFAAQQRGVDPPGPPDRMNRGRQLFIYGSAAGPVPGCSACHAPGGIGMGHMHRGGMSMMGLMVRRAPGLYGQHATYVVRQLTAFADGTRPARVMDRIARAMTAQQKQDVADYVAAHP